MPARFLRFPWPAFFSSYPSETPQERFEGFRGVTGKKGLGHYRGTTQQAESAYHGPVPIFSVVDLAENIAATTTPPIIIPGAAFFREVNDGKNRPGK